MKKLEKKEKKIEKQKKINKKTIYQFIKLEIIF